MVMVEVVSAQTVVALRPPRDVQEFCLQNGITPFPEEFIRRYEQRQIQKLLDSAQGFDRFLAWASPVLRPLFTTTWGIFCWSLLLSLSYGLLSAGYLLHKGLPVVVGVCLLALFMGWMMVWQRKVLSGWMNLPYRQFAQNHLVPKEMAFLADSLYKLRPGKIEVEFLGADPILKVTDRHGQVCYPAIWDEQGVRIGYRAEEV